MKNFKIYALPLSYLDYMRDESIGGDKRVSFAKPENQIRKYVGVVFQIKNFHYFAPLSSQTKKIDKKTNLIVPRKYKYDIYLNDKKGKIIAALKINNMIPISESLLKSTLEFIDINKMKKSNNINERKYAFLLQKELIAINKLNKFNEILKKSEELYLTYDQPDPLWKQYSLNLVQKNEICCDFKKLEKHSLNYEKWLNQTKEKTVSKSKEIIL